jgi:hypothetical protein
MSLLKIEKCGDTYILRKTPEDCRPLMLSLVELASLAIQAAELLKSDHREPRLGIPPSASPGHWRGD